MGDTAGGERAGDGGVRSEEARIGSLPLSDRDELGDNCQAERGPWAWRAEGLAANAHA